MEAEQVANFRNLQNLQNFASGKNSQPANFFSLWLQFLSDFSRELQVRLGFFVLGLTLKFWPD